MNPQLVQRAVWLAGITLIAAIAAVAITRRDFGNNRNLPGAVVVPGTEERLLHREGGTIRTDRQAPTHGVRQAVPENDRRRRPSRLALWCAALHPLPGTRGSDTGRGPRPERSRPRPGPHESTGQSPGPPRHPDDPVALRPLAATLRAADPVRGLRINVEPTKTLREPASGDGFGRKPAGHPPGYPGSQRAQDTAGSGREVRRAFGAA